jgi:hypothetical protein
MPIDPVTGEIVKQAVKAAAEWAFSTQKCSKCGTTKYKISEGIHTLTACGCHLCYPCLHKICAAASVSIGGTTGKKCPVCKQIAMIG